METLLNLFEKHSEIVLGTLTVIVSVVLANWASTKSQRQNSLAHMYEKVFYPIRVIIEDDIVGYDKDNSYSVKTEHATRKIEQIRSVIEKCNGAHSTNLAGIIDSLNESNYKDFCKYIEKNYRECQSLLQIYDPYPLHGKKVHTARIICVVSLILMILSYISIFIFVEAEQFIVAILCCFLFASSLFVAFLSRKSF